MEMCSCCCCSLSFELGKMLIRWNSKLEFFIAWCYVYDGFCDWHIVTSVGNFANWWMKEILMFRAEKYQNGQK